MCPNCDPAFDTSELTPVSTHPVFNMDGGKIGEMTAFRCPDCGAFWCRDLRAARQVDWVLMSRPARRPGA